VGQRLSRTPRRVEPKHLIDQLIGRALIEQTKETAKKLAVSKAWWCHGNDYPSVIAALSNPARCEFLKVGSVVGQDGSALFVCSSQVELVRSIHRPEFLRVSDIEAVATQIDCTARVDVVVEKEASGKTSDRHYSSNSGGSVSHV
jgi:hypothetical protein